MRIPFIAIAAVAAAIICNNKYNVIARDAEMSASEKTEFAEIANSAVENPENEESGEEIYIADVTTNVSSAIIETEVCEDESLEEGADPLKNKTEEAADPLEEKTASVDYAFYTCNYTGNNYRTYLFCSIDEELSSSNGDYTSPKNWESLLEENPDIVAYYEVYVGEELITESPVMDDGTDSYLYRSATGGENHLGTAYFAPDSQMAKVIPLHNPAKGMDHGEFVARSIYDDYFNNMEIVIYYPDKEQHITALAVVEGPASDAPYEIGTSEEILKMASAKGFTLTQSCIEEEEAV